jgi:hypothetical protein
MNNTYRNCSNLTGFAICGKNVSYMERTYQGCKNIRENAYFYSENIYNVRNCFGNRNTLSRLNLYVKENSRTNTTVHYTNYLSSLVGVNITWNDAGTYQYNEAYNIYIYPVQNVINAAIANGDDDANINASVISNVQ